MIGIMSSFKSSLWLILGKMSFKDMFEWIITNSIFSAIIKSSHMVSPIYDELYFPKQSKFMQNITN